MKNIFKLFLVLFIFCLFGLKSTFAKKVSIFIQKSPSQYTKWEEATLTFWIERSGQKVTKKRKGQEYTEIITQQEEKINLNKPDEKKKINLNGTRNGDRVFVKIFIIGEQSVQIDPFKREDIPNVVHWKVDFKEVKDRDILIIEQYKEPKDKESEVVEETLSIPTSKIEQHNFRLKLEEWVSAQGETVVQDQTTKKLPKKQSSTTKETTETKVQQETAIQQVSTIPVQ